MPRRLALALTLLASCTPAPGWSDEPPDLRTRHLEIYLHDGAEVCAPRLADADDFVDALASYLGVEAPPIQYHVYPSGSRVPGCGEADVGCTVALTRADGSLGARIDASSFFLYHEAVHALAARLGDAPAFLSEGLAVALTPQPPYYRYEGPRELAGVLTSDAWYGQPQPAVLYERAGDFVRFVIERSGIAAVVAWYEASDDADDEAAIRGAFEAATGEPLEDALATWSDGPRVPNTIASELVGVPQCASEGLSLEGGVLEGASEVPACAPLGAPRFASRARVAIEIPAEGVYLLELGAPGVSIAVHACETGELRVDRAFDASPQDRVLLELSAGRHVLALTSASEGTAVAAPWRLSRIAGDASSCAAPPALTLTPDHPRALLVGDPRGWPAWDVERRAAALEVTASERGTLTMTSGMWCDACDAACTEGSVAVEAGSVTIARPLAPESPSASFELEWAPP